MTYKPYNTKFRHDGRATEHIARLSRDMGLEVKKSARLLKQIASIVMTFHADPTYRLLHELEVLNQRLEDIIEIWGNSKQNPSG